MSAAEAWLWQLWLDSRCKKHGPEQPRFSLRFDGFGRHGDPGGRPVAGAIGANLTTCRLAFIFSAAIMTILGGSSSRGARLAAIDITALFDMHRQAAEAGGMGVFLDFFV